MRTLRIGTFPLVGLLVLSLLLAAIAPAVGTSPSRGPTSSPAPDGARGPAPSISPPYVFQEGIEFVSEDNEVGIPPAYLVAQFTLPNTTLPTAWTLSGLSSTGDRYLLWAGYGIPYTGTGCPSSGYSLGYQVGSSSGSEGSTECVTTISPAAGDEVELELDLACGGTVGDLCVTLADETLAASSSPSIAQPTPTATYFANDVPSVPNPHGWFTGVETVVGEEVADSGCLSITGLPTVSYYLQGYLPTSAPAEFVGLNLSAYQVFANETEPSGTVCGNFLSPSEDLPASPASQVYQAGGSSDGPHWLSVANWTSIVRGPSMGRFQTDAAPVTASMELNRSSADAGQPVRANVTASGGTGPYTCAWSVDGAPITGTACSLNLTADPVGILNLSALVTDAHDDTGLAYAPLTVYADPTLLAPVASPGSIDLGQSVDFTAALSGGAGGFDYAWTTSFAGPACPPPPPSASALACTPISAGAATVSVTVTDAFHAVATSPTLTFVTNSDPTAGLSLAPGAPRTVDVGGSSSFIVNASGGAGGYRYDWHLPPGACVLLSTTARCTADTPGTFGVNVTVTDADGYVVTTPTISLTVDPLPDVVVEATPSSGTVGLPWTLNVSVTGGEAPYTYAWTGLPGGCSPPAGASLACAPSSAGTFNISVNVTDALGGVGRGVLAVTVDPGPASSSGTFLGLGWPGALAVVVVVVAGIVLGIVLRRRSRPPGGPPPEGYVLVSGPTVRPPDDST